MLLSVLRSLSRFPMAYQMQANQCASRANEHIRRHSTAIPYSEYWSNLRATRTRRNKRAVFNSPINVVAYQLKSKKLDQNQFPFRMKN